MKKPKVILLTGYAGVGKDTTCRLIAEIMKRRTYKANPADYVHRIAFADALKKEYAWNNNICLPDLERDKNFHREGIQSLADETRAINPMVWIDAANSTFDKRLSIDVLEFGLLQSYFVFTDTRNLNEMEHYCSRDDLIVNSARVYRPHISKFNSHVSENELTLYPVDFVINNVSDTDFLRAQCVTYLTLIGWL